MQVKWATDAPNCWWLSDTHTTRSTRTLPTAARDTQSTILNAEIGHLHNGILSSVWVQEQRVTDQESSDRPALGHRGEKNGKQATKITSELGGFGSPMVIVFTATITCSVVIVIPLGIRILRGLLVAGWPTLASSLGTKSGNTKQCLGTYTSKFMIQWPSGAFSANQYYRWRNIISGVILLVSTSVNRFRPRAIDLEQTEAQLSDDQIYCLPNRLRCLFRGEQLFGWMYFYAEVT